MKVRANIFETNSSSTHSFVLYGKNTDYVTPIIDLNNHENIYYINCGYFGWEEGELSHWEHRAEYLATYAVTCGKEGDVERFEKEMSDYLGVNVKIDIANMDRHDDIIGIDHQSVDDAAEMFKDIKTTVFARRGYIRTGNDNG